MGLAARRGLKFDMAVRTNGKIGESLARRALEDRGYLVHDANIIFLDNCPNIDLVFFDGIGGRYAQVKYSVRPAGKDHVTVDGSPWNEGQLYNKGAIFNKHPDHYIAEFIIVVHQNGDHVDFYIAPPKALEPLLRRRGRAWAKVPKRDGNQRSVSFRKELPKEKLKLWLEAWHLLDRKI